MLAEICCCFTAKDWISLILGAVFSGIFTLILIEIFRPKICLGKPTIENDKKGIQTLKLPVRNISRFFSVINLRIEAAFVNNDGTYHLDFDRHDFLILPRLKVCSAENPHERTFKSQKINEYAAQFTNNQSALDKLDYIYKDPNTKLRVRVHGYHEFTGFGKAFEANFHYVNSNFVRL